MQRLLVLCLAAVPIVTCSGPAQSQTSRSVAKLIAAAKGNHPASELPRMCVNAHAATATADKTLELMRTLGVDCARIDWNWDWIEREPGKYDWDGNVQTSPSGPVSFSSYFAAICNAGVLPIFVATYNNALYSAGPFAAISGAANIDGFTRFGVALAEQISALKCANPVIEVFNEPNLTVWTNGVQWSGSDYAPVLVKFSSAVKAARPGVKVFSGGVSPGGGTMPVPWIKQMIRAGEIFPQVDSFAVHPYNFHGPPHADLTPRPDQLLLDLQAFRIASGGSKPVSITEYGFPYAAVGDSLDKQGIYLGWAMLDAIVARVPYFVTYDLVDDGADYGATNENTYGLFFNGAALADHPLPGATSYGIKPSGMAFRSVTTAMASAKSYKVGYDNAASAATIAFEKPGGTSFAIWTISPTGPQAYSATIGEFTAVSCRDLLGKNVACNYANGKLSLALSTSVGPIIATASR